MKGPEPDWYAVLQVAPTAEPEVIAAAFKRLSMKYHPDHDPTPQAQERQTRLNAAFEVIGDPLKRAQYDARRQSSQDSGTRSTKDSPRPKSAAKRAVATRRGWRASAISIAVAGLLFAIGAARGSWFGSNEARSGHVSTLTTIGSPTVAPLSGGVPLHASAVATPPPFETAVPDTPLGVEQPQPRPWFVGKWFSHTASLLVSLDSSTGRYSGVLSIRIYSNCAGGAPAPCDFRNVDLTIDSSGSGTVSLSEDPTYTGFATGQAIQISMGNLSGELQIHPSGVLSTLCNELAPALACGA